MWEGCLRRRAKYELRKYVWVQEFQVPLWDVSGVERTCKGERRRRCGAGTQGLPFYLVRKKAVPRAAPMSQTLALRRDSHLPNPWLLPPGQQHTSSDSGPTRRRTQELRGGK